MKARVLQLLPALNSGGVEQGTLDIADALVKQGYVSIVVSSGGRLVPQLVHSESQHLSLPVGAKNPVSFLYSIFKLRDIIQSHQIHIVHARSRIPAWIAYFAIKKTSARLVTTYHGAYSSGSRIKKFYNKIMSMGNPCIAVSEYIASHIMDQYPDRQAFIKLIPRGINLSRFEPHKVSKEKIEALKRQWQITEDMKVCLLPGRVTRIKGQEQITLLLEDKTFDDCCFVLAGEMDPSSRYVQSLMKAIAPYRDRVRLVGHCEDMPAAFAIADVVMLLTRKPESFGRVICEAQYAERLVIASDHGGAKETMSNTMKAGLYEPNNPTDLKRAFSWAINLDQETKHEVLRSASTYVAERFPLEKMTTETLAIYEQIIDRSSDSARHRQ